MVKSRGSSCGGLQEIIFATRCNLRSPRCSHVVSISTDAPAALSTLLNRIRKCSIGANVWFASASRNACCARSSCLSRAASFSSHLCLRVRVLAGSSFIATSYPFRMYPTSPRSDSFRPYRYQLCRWEPFPAQRVAVAKSSYFACFGVYSEKYRNSADCPSIG